MLVIGIKSKFGFSIMVVLVLGSVIMLGLAFRVSIRVSVRVGIRL